jgi:hypothetical protein
MKLGAQTKARQASAVRRIVCDRTLQLRVFLVQHEVDCFLYVWQAFSLKKL